MTKYDDRAWKMKTEALFDSLKISTAQRQTDSRYRVDVNPTDESLFAQKDHLDKPHVIPIPEKGYQKQ